MIMVFTDCIHGKSQNSSIMLILLFCSSQLVGLPTVTKDKISAYNFLDVESLTKTPAELSEFTSKTFQSLPLVNTSHQTYHRCFGYDYIAG